MTQSEKNISYSENCLNSENKNYPALKELKHDLQYLIIVGKKYVEHTFSEDCYVNILADEQCDTTTYQLNEKKFLLNKGENILHHVKSNSKILIPSTCQSNRLVFICISPLHFEAFHEKTLQEPFRFINGFLTKQDNRVSLLLSNLFELDENISLDKLKTEAIILELLIRQIEILHVENENHEVIPHKSHYDKIMSAKKLIDSDLTKSYSISELAKEVGTNEQYLKTYFKQYFNKTIQQYSTDKKMGYAKDLILTGNLRVADVARMTGYKHSTHFTTAFKKYFGFIPNSLRYTFLLAHESVVAIAESGITNIL
ncbi:helix-turn-helix domain-containing protein [Sphingobacterium hungaricum]